MVREKKKQGTEGGQVCTLASFTHAIGTFKLPTSPRMVHSSNLAAECCSRSLIAFSRLFEQAHDHQHPILPSEEHTKPKNGRKEKLTLPILQYVTTRISLLVCVPHPPVATHTCSPTNLLTDYVLLPFPHPHLHQKYRYFSQSASI